jgi:hypothetical protein
MANHAEGDRRVGRIRYPPNQAATAICDRFQQWWGRYLATCARLDEAMQAIETAIHDRLRKSLGQYPAAHVRDKVDELELSWRTKERERIFLNMLEVCKRGLLYVLAFFGIIALGCLSGLPSATCFALQDLYTIALTIIGIFPGVMTVSAYLVISMGEQAVKQGQIISSKSSRLYFACTLVGILFLYLVVISFLTDRGVKNIGTAIEHCRLVGSDAARQDKIPLYRGFWGEAR